MFPPEQWLLNCTEIGFPRELLTTVSSAEVVCPRFLFFNEGGIRGRVREEIADQENSLINNAHRACLDA